MSEKGLFDIHCHIVPDVDDGSSSLEESLGMLKMEYEQGVRSIIATPHFRVGMFETPQDKIERQFLLLKQKAEEEIPELNLYLGCEFHVNMDMPQDLKKGLRPTMAGSSFALCEFPRPSDISFIHERLRALCEEGFRPVMAHIERYEAVKNGDGLRLAKEFAALGGLIQVNADSVLGDGDLKSMQLCDSLLKERLVSFVASDCHGTSYRAPNTGRAYKYISENFGEAYAEEIFVLNPLKILKDANNRNNNTDAENLSGGVNK